MTRLQGEMAANSFVFLQTIHRNERVLLWFGLDEELSHIHRTDLIYNENRNSQCDRSLSLLEA